MAKLVNNKLTITTTTPTEGWDRYNEAHLVEWQSVFSTSFTTSITVVLSSLILALRIKGVSAPNFLDIFAIFFESVETITRSNNFDFSAVVIA